MSITRIYLAGRCKGLEDEGMEWRKKATEALYNAASWKDARISVLNPLDYFSYKDNKAKSHKQVKGFYMNRIKNCDLVLVNLDGTNESIGTAQEIQYAVDHDITVIGFNEGTGYPWIEEVDCQVTFGNLFEAVDYIRDHYLVDFRQLGGDYAENLH